MGWNDHYPQDFIEHIVNCKECGKRFRFITEDQVPGCRAMDELYCPYCKAKLAQSMEVEFSKVEGLEDDK